MVVARGVYESAKADYRSLHVFPYESALFLTKGLLPSTEWKNNAAPILRRREIAILLKSSFLGQVQVLFIIIIIIIATRETNECKVSLNKQIGSLGPLSRTRNFEIHSFLYLFHNFFLPFTKHFGASTFSTKLAGLTMIEFSFAYISVYVSFHPLHFSRPSRFHSFQKRRVIIFHRPYFPRPSSFYFPLTRRSLSRTDNGVRVFAIASKTTPRHNGNCFPVLRQRVNLKQPFDRSFVPFNIMFAFC